MQEPGAAPSGDFFLLFSFDVPDARQVDDAALLRRVLAELPAAIGMRALCIPKVLEATNNPGLEGYVAIDASNITLSTYRQPPRMVGCIHSCAPFEAHQVLARMRAWYNAEAIRFRFCDETLLDQAY